MTEMNALSNMIVFDQFLPFIFCATAAPAMDCSV